MPPRSASRRRPWRLVTVLVVLVAAAGAVAALVLAGADFRGDAAPPPSSPASGAPSHSAQDTGAPTPADPARTAAEQAAERVRGELSALAADTGTPDRGQMSAAMTAAGLAPESVQVSQDITPTGLDVDYIVAAANVEGSCVFAEVRGGKVAVTLLDPLADGGCFVGGDG